MIAADLTEFFDFAMASLYRGAIFMYNRIVHEGESERNMKRTLSISEWHYLALEGTAPPVRIQLNGDSMYPLIRRNWDYVTVVQLQEKPAVGDLVLFTTGSPGRYIVHRVWDVRDGSVLIWGDNCLEPDGWFPVESIWGKIVLIERGRRKIYPNPKKGFRWASFWHRIRPGYVVCYKIKDGISCRKKKSKCEVSSED